VVCAPIWAVSLQYQVGGGIGIRLICRPSPSHSRFTLDRQGSRRDGAGAGRAAAFTLVSISTGACRSPRHAGGFWPLIVLPCLARIAADDMLRFISSAQAISALDAPF